MSTFCIEFEDLYNLDQFLDVDNADQLDEEIEGIVTALWADVGPGEELLRPFFTTFLQSNLLRPLYIYYFSLKAIRERYPRVVVNASNCVLDIVATSLDIELNPNRSMHDEEFYLVRHYLFSKGSGQGAGWKSALRGMAWAWARFMGRVRGIDVLYLNAGKLDEDFQQVRRSLSATLIPHRHSRKLTWNAEGIGDRILKNIGDMRLSIPAQCVQRLVELRVLAYLADVLNRIGALAEAIEKYRVKLVVATAFTHEDHLCLLAAANVAQAESLVVAHGVTLAKNAFLDHYITCQATLNEIEPKYAGAAQFPMRYKWFERKI